MAEPDPAADPVTPAEEGSSWRSRVVPGTVAVLLVALLAFGGVATWKLRSFDDRDDRRAEASSVASRAVTYLVTLDEQSADANLQSLLKLAASNTPFRADLTRLAASFRATVADGKVSSVGEIRSAGLVRMSGSEAVVAVAASATVRNSDSPDGGPRNYRFDVTLQRVGDDWKILNMEFVV